MVMIAGATNDILRQLRRVALLRDGADLGDGELLECFIARRDEAAFEALLRRHGPMVLGTCRRVLGNETDAEDAFQATFLVLARKAASIRPRGQVGNWLYGVAYRTALKARAAAVRRQAKEREAGMRAGPEPPDEVWQRLQGALDAELHALPERYRVAVVLCDLEGKTRKEAARQLGWPEGTVASRVVRGRCLLARRLARHRLTLSGGALSSLMTQNAAAAAVPLGLAGATMKAATMFAARRGAAAVPPYVAALTQEVLRAMFLSKLKMAGSLVVLVALVTSAAGLGASRALAKGDWQTWRAPAATPVDRASKRGPGAELQATCAVKWGGSWWPAVVLATRDEKYLVHYTNWENTWDEWVTAERIQLLSCSVEWKGAWYPAVLLQVKNGRYYIHYVGYDETWDEWVPRERTRFKDCLVEWQGRWWPAVLLETKGEKHKIHYTGYDDTWDEWVGEDRLRLAVPCDEPGQTGNVVLEVWHIFVATPDELAPGEREHP
jgi:RNA polymerase sigma factor (sigma-70 family)